MKTAGRASADCAAAGAGSCGVMIIDCLVYRADENWLARLPRERRASQPPPDVTVRPDVQFGKLLNFFVAEMPRLPAWRSEHRETARGFRGQAETGWSFARCAIGILPFGLTPTIKLAHPATGGPISNYSQIGPVLGEKLL